MTTTASLLADEMIAGGYVLILVVSLAPKLTTRPLEQLLVSCMQALQAGRRRLCCAHEQIQTRTQIEKFLAGSSFQQAPLNGASEAFDWISNVTRLS